MALGYLILNLILITGYNALPVHEDHSAVSLGDTESGMDDGDTIDLSRLGPNAFGYPSRESGYAVGNWTKSSLVNPEEMGEYAEGDILIPQGARNGLRDRSKRWKNGTIPFVIGGNFGKEDRDTIKRAIDDYHNLTCIRFVPYEDETDYISITSTNTGCWSSVGRMGGHQFVNLQSPGCVNKGTVIHELLHAAGFLHEQSRPERDDFVKINFQNISPRHKHNFKKAEPNETIDFGVTYDYGSVMHYSAYAFSRNYKKTIEPKVDGVKIGQREGFSEGDIKKVNRMYNCTKEEPKNERFGSNTAKFIWEEIKL